MRYSGVFSKKSSKIILGTDYYGEERDEDVAFSLLDKFFEMGGNHIDTARLYTNGKSEEIVGKWLKSRKPKDAFIATKGGCFRKEAPNVKRITEKDIREDAENSLRALGVDCLDLYWLHRDDENVEVAAILEWMNRLIDEGKIRSFGASNWRGERIVQARDYAENHGLTGFAASQLRFSPAVVNPKEQMPDLVEMDKGEFDCYLRLKSPVVAYSSQAKGFFSKIISSGEGGLSEKARNRYLNPENLATLAVLKKLSAKYDISVASLIACAFSSFEGPEVFPVVGCSNEMQLEDTLERCDIVIPREEIREIFAQIIGN